MTSAAAPSGVRWTVTDRRGGFSAGPYESLNLAEHVGDDPVAVARNRGLVAESLGVSPAGVAVMLCAHGRDVAVVSEGGTIADVDVLVTDTPGVALLATAADCATVALADPVARVVAAVHSGWRGVVADAAGAAVAAMAEMGAEPGRVQAVIAPVICSGCYEVSSDVRDQVCDAAGQAWAQTRWGTPSVDVRAGVEQQLRAAGVTDVAANTTCTFEQPELYSYRRDGLTGRHGVMVALVGG